MICLPVLSSSFVQSIKSWLWFLYVLFSQNRREVMHVVSFVLLCGAYMYRQDGGGPIVPKSGQGRGVRSSTGEEDRSGQVSWVRQAGESQK